MTEVERTIRAWHAALNAGALERLLALSADDVEVGGPRGSGRGAQLLSAWVARSGIQLDPLRIFERSSTAAVEQDARWPGDAQVHRLASVFRVEHGTITSVIRYPDLPSALAAAEIEPVS
jgi:ketosteroid isomerase-like protein